MAQRIRVQDWGEMHQPDGRGFLADMAEPQERWMQRIAPGNWLAVETAIAAAVKGKSLLDLSERATRATQQRRNWDIVYDLIAECLDEA